VTCPYDEFSVSIAHRGGEKLSEELLAFVQSTPNCISCPVTNLRSLLNPQAINIICPSGVVFLQEGWVSSALSKDPVNGVLIVRSTLSGLNISPLIILGPTAFLEDYKEDSLNILDSYGSNKDESYYSESKFDQYSMVVNFPV
jgi:hypothetical protein